MKLGNTKALVKSILETIPETRSSDTLLYYEVCKVKNEYILDEPFGGVLRIFSKLGLPPFESVRRSRQKVQEEHPELAASAEVQVFRAENEEEYREFARGH
jgi:hypothetical protein